MSRVRMSWEWVGEYPIFVFTTWIDNAFFHVKVVKYPKGDQNAPGYGPDAPAWRQYRIRGYFSKDEVVDHALKQAERWIKECH